MIPTRFSVACHAVVALAKAGTSMTSATLAEHLRKAPVPLRRVMNQLKRAKVVTSGKAGPAAGRGYKLARAPKDISVIELWDAVHPPKQRLIQIHTTADEGFLVAMRAMTGAAEARLRSVFTTTTVHDLVQATERN